MKWLAIALVLANIGFCTWQASAPPPREPLDIAMVTSEDEHVASLSLVTPELEAQMRKTHAAAQASNEMHSPAEQAPAEMQAASPVHHMEAVTMKQPTASSAAKTARCFEAGPFGNRAESGKLVERLRERGVAAFIDRRETKERNGYWVLLAATTSEAAAQKNLRRLQAKGFTDVMLMTKGEFRNAISLGIYSYLKTANERSDEVRQRGFDPQVQPRYRTRARYWVVVRSNDEAGAGMPQGLMDNPGAKFGSVACE